MSSSALSAIETQPRSFCLVMGPPSQHEIPLWFPKASHHTPIKGFQLTPFLWLCPGLGTGSSLPSASPEAADLAPCIRPLLGMYSPLVVIQPTSRIPWRSFLRSNTWPLGRDCVQGTTKALEKEERKDPDGESLAAPHAQSSSLGSVPCQSHLPRGSLPAVGGPARSETCDHRCRP